MHQPFDPGADLETFARSGVGREIARLRSVELEAVAAVPVAATSADGAAAIAEVRNSGLGLPLLEVGFDTMWPDSAGQARAVVVAATNILSDPLDPLTRRSDRSAARKVQSRKLLNCSGIPMSSAFSIAMTSCR